MENEIKTNRVSIDQLKNQIKSNYFKSKDALFEYLINLRNNGMMEEIDNKKMRELLDLYDDMHSFSNSSLDMSNYDNRRIDNQNLIIAKHQDRIIQTNEDTSRYSQEFTRIQNELSAVDLQTTLVDADRILESMATKKVEMKLMSIKEVVEGNYVNIDILNQIKFLIKSGYTDPALIEVDINSGLFYNKDTKDVYKIKYNTSTRQHEIWKNNQLDYTEQQLKEYQAQEKEKNKPKTRVLEKEEKPYLNNAAFTKISFLILNTISIGLIIAIAILLNK